MCETLAGLKQAGSAFAARFDAALVPPAQLPQVLADAGTLEKIFANVAAACAARMAGAGGSVREAVAGLARASGTSLSEAARALEAARLVEAQPDVAEAVRSGELSRQQAAVVVGAVATNPDAGPRLLELARTASMRELAEESGRARSAGQDAEARRRAVHRTRSLRDYVDAEGAFNLHARGTIEQGAAVMAALKAFSDEAFEVARKEGRRERPEAYAFDALVELARSGGGGPARSEIMVRVDHSALLRGYANDGEVCEIAGLGPTSVQAVIDMMDTGDPFLKAVVTKAKDVVGVVHLGRRPNAYQQTALDWLFPSCAANACGTRGEFLQTDHREDWARTHVTVLELLDRLCRYHHGLKTYQGWALVEGKGKRDFVPPDDPRHPRHKAQAPRATSDQPPGGRYTDGALTASSISSGVTSTTVRTLAAPEAPTASAAPAAVMLSG